MLSEQLLAPLLGEEIDDAVERLVGAVGVQGGQHQVAGFGELNPVFHGLAVADFADENHVGRLAQRVLERQMPAVAIDADLAVRDDAPLVRMHVLDGILDRDDVAAGLLVPVSDHRGQRRRLARTRAADQNHEAALRQHDFLQHRRQFQFFEGRNLRVDGSEHRTREALLHERADAKASDSRRRDREIAFLGRIELLGLPIVHDGAYQARALLGTQGPVRLRSDFAVDLDGGRKSGRNEQVRTLLLHHAP